MVGDLHGEIVRSTVVLALANLVWYWLTWLFLCESPRHFRLGNKYAKIRVFSVGIHDLELLIIILLRLTALPRAPWLFGFIGGQET